MITPRENLLRSLRCQDPEWIPVCLSLVPNEHPTRGIPEDLEEVFNVTWGSQTENVLTLGNRWGAEDYLLAVLVR